VFKYIKPSIESNFLEGRRKKIAKARMKQIILFLMGLG